MTIKFNDDHEKVVAIAIVALLLVSLGAIIAAVIGIYFKFDATALITLAGAAVGGIAGFITHKVTSQPNGVKGPVLESPGNQSGDPGKELTFSLKAVSPDGYSLTYSMAHVAEIDTDPLNSTTGDFSWTPRDDDADKKFIVTFVVTDGHGGSDSKTITITVNPKSITSS